MNIIFSIYNFYLIDEGLFLIKNISFVTYIKIFYKKCDIIKLIKGSLYMKNNNNNKNFNKKEKWKLDDDVIKGVVDRNRNRQSDMLSTYKLGEYRKC